MLHLAVYCEHCFLAKIVFKIESYTSVNALVQKNKKSTKTFLNFA